MFLYEMARKANRKLKERKKRQMGRFVSPVRRIERVYPVKGRRVCAMTFDDGPTCALSSPDVASGHGLSRYLIDTLKEFGATATFDVIGDTSENYPDTCGEHDTFYWGGESYDHYPRYGEDHKAGAKNCPELIKYLIGSGFELSNHGYRHLIFGKNRVYGKRVPLRGFDEVTEDLKRLHSLIRDTYGYNMTLSRPPHYIDNISGGLTSYDAYELMGYNYMAASFDGAGWMPQKGSYEDDVKGMVAPLKKLLEENPDSLNGQIIFQKDGCNMSGFTPVASALPLQLKLLGDYGYRVCSVGELLGQSPFSDLPSDDECFESVRKLCGAGIVIGYKNNEIRPDCHMTFGELCMALCPKEDRQKRVLLLSQGQTKLSRFPLSHPYSAAMAWAESRGAKFGAAFPVDGRAFKLLLDKAGLDPVITEKSSYTRREALCILGEKML